MAKNWRGALISSHARRQRCSDRACFCAAASVGAVLRALRPGAGRGGRWRRRRTRRPARRHDGRLCRGPALEELKPVGMDGSGDMPDPPCGGRSVGAGPPQLIGGDCRSARFLRRRGRRAHRPFRRFRPPAARCRRQGPPVWRSGCGSRGRKGAFSFAYPQGR